jgi:hypothetical protein
MKTAKLIGVLTIACLGVLPAAAQAKGPAETNVAIYGGTEYSATRGVVFGQVFAGKPSCVAKRKFNLVVTDGSESTVVDSGKASAEGGIAGSVKFSELSLTSDLSLATPKTSDCKKASTPLDMSGKLAARPKPAKSDVLVVDVNGLESDGAVAGVVTSGKRKCVAGRKVKLTVDGIKRDAGTTSEDGAFGLHITSNEAKGSSKIKVSVKGNSNCSGGSGVFEEIMAP